MTTTVRCPPRGRAIHEQDHFYPRCSAPYSLKGADAAPSDGYASRSAAADAQLLRPATNGDHEIQTAFRRGSRLIVCFAHELAMDRRTAIKALLPTLLWTESMAHRFKNVALTAARIRDPCNIPVYAVGETEKVVFLVMKFVEGWPLDDVPVHAGGFLRIPLTFVHSCGMFGALWVPPTAYFARRRCGRARAQADNMRVNRLSTETGPRSITHASPRRRRAGR
jgi:hypothetical protein